MNMKTLLAVLPFYEATANIETVEVNHIAMNDKKVEQGTLFVCIKGFTVDGHTFAKEAEERGAVAIIAEKPLNDVNIPVIIVKDTTRAMAVLANTFYNYPSNQLSLVGITGTNGKTTITYLLEHILQLAKKHTGIIGTIQTKIGDDVIPVKNTTPDALTLQHTFAQMVEEKVDIVAMEVSSHALHMGRVNECDFDIAVYTNLSQDHLDYHESMANYLQAKSLLFSRLGNTAASDKQKFAVINIDDAYGEEMMRATAQHIITYGLTNKADIYAENIRYSIEGTAMDIKTAIGAIHIQTPLIGKFNVYNILAATAVAIIEEIDLETIRTSLQTNTGVDGRFEKVIAGQDFAVIVDYAHTPDSLENVLQTIRQFANQKIYVVVGTGGDRDKTKRPLMGEIAVQYADHAIFTTDNPRTENPESILQHIVEPLKASNYEIVIDRKDAINKAIAYAKQGDVILIAGKGHETYQEIHGVRYDFDDRLIAKEAIEQKEQ